MAFLDSNLHTLLAIVNENELGLAFPPRNLPKKFHPDPSTFYLVIVVTNIKTWIGLCVEESIRMTEDRDKWRKYVHGVANPRIENG